MLDDLHALVEFAQAGSMAGAAGRLFRTPSAVTRQLQRLEAALGAELLDRSVKPPRLNSLGSKVLEQARDLLQRAEAVKSLASRDTEPHGLMRIGLAHPLAEGTLVEPIRVLTETFAKLRLLLLSQRTPELFNRLIAGELDVAVVPLPEQSRASAATDECHRDRPRGDRPKRQRQRRRRLEELGKSTLGAQSAGCFLRAGLIDRMGLAGQTPMIAAEIHNMHLQLAFVQSGYGVGLLPSRFIAGNDALDMVEVLRPPSFDLHMSVAMVRVGQLGALERAVDLLEHGIRQLFERASTTKAVTTSRRRERSNRRKARPRK